MALSVATSVSKLFSGAIVYVAFARLLGVAEYGRIGFGLSFALIVVAFAEYGYSVMAMRDIPQERYELDRYVFNVFLQKALFTVITFAIGTYYLYSLQEEGNHTIGMNFLIFGLLYSHTAYLLCVFRATNNYLYECIVSMFYAGLLVLILIAMNTHEMSVELLSICLLFSRIMQLGLSVLIYWRWIRIGELRFDKGIQRYLLMNSWSFGIHYVAGFLYMQIDTQVLSICRSSYEVGIFQSVMRLIFVFLVVAEIIVNVYMPYLAQLYRNKGAGAVIDISNLLVKYLVMIGFSFYLFLCVFVKEIFGIVYGEEYLVATTIVPYLSAILVFRMFGGIHGTILTVSDHQVARLVAVVISMTVSAVMNILLVPRYGVEGAVFASMATHIVLHAIYLVYTRRYLGSYLFARSTIVTCLLGVMIAILVICMSDMCGYMGPIALLIWCIYIMLETKWKEIRKLFPSMQLQ